MGASLSDKGVPLWYTGTEEEYWAVTKSSGLSDLSHMGRLTVSGKDRVAFLNGLLTNDITKIGENTGIHSVLLNTKARILADLYLYSQPDSLVVDTGDAQAAHIKSILDQFIITEDVKIENSGETLVLLTLQGPASAETLKDILGVQVKDLSPLQTRSIGPSLVIARDRTGKSGYDLLVPRDEAEAVWQGFLLKGGKTGLLPVGFNAMDILRLENASPRYGVDLDENTIVLEAGFQDAISFTKGCYMGQEVVARATHIGRVNRRLVQLYIDAKTSPPARTQLLADGKEVGSITSSAFSPGLGRVVGLGYVQRDYASMGREMEVTDAGENALVKVGRIL